MSSLSSDGIELIKVLEDNVDYEELFRQTESEFPEFNNNVDIYALGGFAVYGNPSSFHNKLVRDLRMKAYNKVIASKAFQKYLMKVRKNNYKDYKLEFLFDRIMHRHINQVPASETAHRDITPIKYLKEQDDDIIFGGWINLSRNSQYFICLPGSHTKFKNTYEISMQHEGFSTIDLESEEYKDYIKNRVRYRIKPGEMIIFPQHIVHEVLGKKSQNEQFRLFTGWRLTLGDTLLFPNKTTTIDNLDIPYIPSGQKPPMFGVRHYINFKDKPFFWIGKDASNKRGSLTEWWTYAIKNDIPLIRFMKSLRHYNLDCANYEYSDIDKNIMLSLHNLF